jgi:flavin reductase (DIM6/NTAB) family NADH-FMN oxidoreductase RutF
MAEPDGRALRVDGVDPLLHRRVVGRFATGVTVVSTRVDGVGGVPGVDHAMTVNSFTSVSLEPVLVLVCIDSTARFHAAVLQSGTWGVSVLAAHQEAVSREFATRGRDRSEQFANVPVHAGGVTGVALVDGALATLECRTVSTLEAGDHTVLVGEVLALDVPDETAEPLLFLEGRYRVLSG